MTWRNKKAKILLTSRRDERKWLEGIPRRVKMPHMSNADAATLALQLGSEVSFNELSRLTGANQQTVEKYITLLEKAFVIFRLPSFSRNVRNEIRKGKKFYFYDNGIRNAIIKNFQFPAQRTDIGALWENFLISERLKTLSMGCLDAESYFWRTTQQQEIDYLEEIDGKIKAYEIKWNPNKNVKFPRTFSKSYPEAALSVINRDNFWDYLGV